MTGAKASIGFASSGTPDEPMNIETIVTTINNLITPIDSKQPKVAAPAFFINNAKLNPATLTAEYKKLHDLLLLAEIAKKSGDSHKFDNAIHWIDKLNIPGGNAYDKLFALERRINDANNTRNNDASDILYFLIGSQVNKASRGAQQTV